MLSSVLINDTNQQQHQQRDYKSSRMTAATVATPLSPTPQPSTSALHKTIGNKMKSNRSIKSKSKTQGNNGNKKNQDTLSSLETMDGKIKRKNHTTKTKNKNKLSKKQNEKAHALMRILSQEMSSSIPDLNSFQDLTLSRHNIKSSRTTFTPSCGVKNATFGTNTLGAKKTNAALGALALTPSKSNGNKTPSSSGSSSKRGLDSKRIKAIPTMPMTAPVVSTPLTPIDPMDSISSQVSAADVFYALMNGEQLEEENSSNNSPSKRQQQQQQQQSLTVPEGVEDDDEEEEEYNEVDFFEGDDVYYYDLEDEEDETEETEEDEHDLPAPTTQGSNGERRGLSRLDSLYGFDVSQELERPQKEDQPQSVREERVVEEEQEEGAEEDEAQLTVEELQKYIMSHMPEELKKKIPEDAWEKIFRQTNDEIQASTPSLIPPPPIASPQQTVVDSLPEDSTVVSEVTCDVEELRLSGHTKETKASTVRSGLTSTGGASLLTSATPTSSVLQRRSKTKVHFGTIAVRQYERILEVNPGVTSGAAIGLGWRYIREGEYTLEEYDLSRSSGISRRGDDLILPRQVREEMLRDMGYSRKQIASATRKILKAKTQRRITVDNLSGVGMVQKVEEKVETVTRLMKGVLSLGRKRGFIKSSKKSSSSSHKGVSSYPPNPTIQPTLANANAM